MGPSAGAEEAAEDVTLDLTADLTALRGMILSRRPTRATRVDLDALARRFGVSVRQIVAALR